MITIYDKLPYPCNLWSAVLEKKVSEEDLPSDWELALEYVLATISQRLAKETLLLYFCEGQGLEDIALRYGLARAGAEYIISQTVEKMRKERRKIFIRHGLSKGQEAVAAIRADKQLLTNASVEHLNLSARAFNCLRRAGIKTIGQLEMCGEQDLLDIRNLGEGTLREIKQCLNTFTNPHSATEETDSAQNKNDRIRSSLVAALATIRAENARARLYNSDERIADYLLALGWTLPVRCGNCSYRFSCHGHDKAGCPLDGKGLMNDDDFCSCGEPPAENLQKEGD